VQGAAAQRRTLALRGVAIPAVVRFRPGRFRHRHTGRTSWRDTSLPSFDAAIPAGMAASARSRRVVRAVCALPPQLPV
jgi:hypothetical protein